VLQSVDRHRHDPTAPLLANPTAFEVRLDRFLSSDGALTMLTMPGHQPGMRVHFQEDKGRVGRSPPERLAGMLSVVMSMECIYHLLHLFYHFMMLYVSHFICVFCYSAIK
jgi:hypothetical protein